MSLELIGYGLIWITLALYALVWRPLNARGRYENRSGFFERLYGLGIFTGALLALLGVTASVSISALELWRSDKARFHEAILMQLQTDDGVAALYRGLTLIVFVGLFMVLWPRIFRAKYISLSEILLIACLLIYGLV